MNVTREITLALQGLRDGVITPCEAADRVEALLGLGVAGGRPLGEDQVRLRCGFYAPGPGPCGWTGTAAEAGWDPHFKRWVCPRCGASEELGIVPEGLPACVECRCPAHTCPASGAVRGGVLPCGHPICDDCYERLYQDKCAACNGHAAWCRFSTEPPDTRPVHPAPDWGDEHQHQVANGEDSAVAAEGIDACLMPFDEWQRHHQGRNGR